jgi:hypothetical protein
MNRTALLPAVLLLALGCSASDADDPRGRTPGPTSSDASTNTGSVTENGVRCAGGYACYGEAGSDLVWVIKNDGNLYGPTCREVCESALSQNCSYRACDDGRAVQATDIAGFAPIAAGLGFTCRPGACWSSVSPVEGAALYLVSIETDATNGSKACYFPSQTKLSCSSVPGNANCFGERYSSVCPCVPKALDQACTWQCPPNNTTRAVWKTSGTSCLARINYWRKKACEDGWVECPPAGLPPMAECTACHECSNSEADFDSKNGAHASFTRCGELVQGEGGGATCADVIDGFVSERAPGADGVVRCTGHCGPIVAPGCRTFSWGRARNSDFHTLNWDGCNVDACQGYCTNHLADCFTVATSPSMTCDDPDVGNEPGPLRLTCP